MTKKILFGLATAALLFACTDDYKDWATPQQVAQPQQVSFADGSGLSSINYVTAEWMVGYLQAIRKSPAFPAFLASIPKPGEGTLSMIRFPGCERVRMKSGSITGTLCYSGYILDAKGNPAVTFSILTNNSLAGTSEVRRALVQLIRKLAE